MGSTKVQYRPDGDLTIEGTNAWMPADLNQLSSEISWTLGRLEQLQAARKFLMQSADPCLCHGLATSNAGR